MLLAGFVYEVRIDGYCQEGRTERGRFMLLCRFGNSLIKYLTLYFLRSLSHNSSLEITGIN